MINIFVLIVDKMLTLFPELVILKIREIKFSKIRLFYFLRYATTQS